MIFNPQKALKAEYIVHGEEGLVNVANLWEFSDEDYQFVWAWEFILQLLLDCTWESTVEPSGPDVWDVTAGVLPYVDVWDQWKFASDFTTCTFPDATLEFASVSAQDFLGFALVETWDVFIKGLPWMESRQT